MSELKKKYFVLIIILVAAAPSFTAAQQKEKEKKRKHEFYFSWGYNTEWYTHSSLNITQPALGNNFTFQNVDAHDHRGWDGQFFTKALSIPQYNYRIGYFFNEEKGLAIEINFDHTKYLIEDDQVIHVTGTMHNKPINSNVLFIANGAPGADSSSYYYLNNGANFLLFNIVKRWHLIANKKGSVKIDGLGKFGIGPVIPHVQNKFFDQPDNTPHFQLGGWNTGLEAALRTTFFKYVYLEYTNKLDYARYSGLKIYDGKAKQAFGTYEMILNLGLSFPVGKKL
jgi:hypothetical protein